MRIVKEKEGSCTSGLAPVLPGQRPCPVKPRRGRLRDNDKKNLVVVVDNENDECENKCINEANLAENDGGIPKYINTT